jgi:hypothetical protein
MGLLGEWLFNEHLNGIQLSRDWPLGTAYGTLDTRYDDICLPPLLTAVDLSGSDAAGGGSAGTAAAVSSAAFTGGMHATEKLIVGRGTKLGAVRLDTRASVFDGTAEGAGAPYAENVTDLLYTKSAGGTHEVSVCYDNTAYRVITTVAAAGTADISVTAGSLHVDGLRITLSANLSMASEGLTFAAVGGSDVYGFLYVDLVFDEVDATEDTNIAAT